MHPKDITKQTHRMWENVETLLKEADCTYDEVCGIIVYLRDISDYQTVKMFFEDHFHGRPYVIVQAPVCRPGWLVEMECMAIKTINNTEYEAF